MCSSSRTEALRVECRVCTWGAAGQELCHEASKAPHVPSNRAADVSAAPGTDCFPPSGGGGNALISGQEVIAWMVPISSSLSLTAQREKLSLRAMSGLSPGGTNSDLRPPETHQGLERCPIAV